MDATRTVTASDAAECERITRTHARTFHLASRLLPAEKRRAAYALYAFCRVADDLVDAGDGTDRDRTRDALASYEAQLHAALDGVASSAVFREVAHVTRIYDVPAAPLFELLRGVRRDLDTWAYPDWSALELYCQGVASSVGEMCTHVFGVDGDGAVLSRAVQHARTLGVAMQLTNILRDIGEDAARGRCYLPADDLRRFGFQVDDVLSTPGIARSPRWRALMQFEIARARALYDSAEAGLAMLTRDAQPCARACASGYAGILGAIERQEFDTFRSRARLGQLARFGILWSAWRQHVVRRPTDVLNGSPAYARHA